MTFPRKRRRKINALMRQQRPLMMDRNALFQGVGSLLFFGLVVAGPILFYVWTRLEVVRLNYQLLDISKEERKLFMQHERLKIELAMLRSPSRLSPLAKNRFHLKNPSQQQIIYMK